MLSQLINLLTLILTAFPNSESSPTLNCDRRKGAMSAEPSPAPSRTSTLPRLIWISYLRHHCHHYGQSTLPRLFFSPFPFLLSLLSVIISFSSGKLFQKAPCSHWSKWIVSGISHWFPWHIGWVPKNRSSCTNNHFSTNHLFTLSKPNKM